MVRFILFSDLHLDAQFAWAPREVARRRRQGLRDTLVRILEVAREVEADAVLCGGDLYEHERFSPDTAQFLRASFEELDPIPIYLAPGNHDWFGPESLYRRVAWSPNVHVFTSDRLEPATVADGLTLWGAAHRAPANTDNFLRSFGVDRGGVNVALFHGSEQGSFIYQEQGKVPHAPFREQEIGQARLNHAFLGHYHRPRDTSCYTYPGNPDPLTFGEDGERGVVVATLCPDGTVVAERRRVAVTAVHDITIDITGCHSRQEIRELVAERLRALDGVARLTLEGELDSDVDLHVRDLADAAPWMDSVIPRSGDLRVGYDLQTIAQEQTVRGEFVNEVLAAELPEETRRRVVITGLRALDARADLEVA